LPKRRLIETKPIKENYLRLLRTRPYMYPPARAFSLGDIITPDPTYYEPLPDAQYWEARKFIPPVKYQSDMAERKEEGFTKDLLTMFAYGKDMTVTHAARSMCLGSEMPEAIYDGYLLPPDPNAPQIPDGSRDVLAVKFTDGMYARVIGRTVIGFPFCRKGEPPFNAAIRIRQLQRILLKQENYQDMYERIKPQVDEVAEQLRIQTNANGKIKEQLSREHALNRKLQKVIDKYKLRDAGLIDYISPDDEDLLS
jgi:hypothetical protein